MMTDRHGPKQLATLVTAYLSVKSLLQEHKSSEPIHPT